MNFFGLFVLAIAILQNASGQWKGWGGQNQWGQQNQQQFGGQQQFQAPPAPPAPPAPADVGSIRGCVNKGGYKMCSNVFVYGPGIQQAVGCPTADGNLYNMCQDTWATSPTECCWCDQGGNRCLLRARRSEKYYVPNQFRADAEPHFRDWRQQSYDYQGLDDHVYAEVGSYRVDVKMTMCSDRSRVTCFTEAAVANTQTKQVVNFKVNNPLPFTCGDNNKLEGDEDNLSNGDIKLKKLAKGKSVAKWAINLGGKLLLEILIEKELMDFIVQLGPNFIEGDIKGGLLTGTAKREVSKFWAKGANRKIPEKFIRVGARKAWTFASTWRLPAAQSYLCSTKNKPYPAAAPVNIPITRVSNVVTNEYRLKYFECCMPLVCSPESYDECIFDHVELNVKGKAAKCISGYSTLAEESCKRTTGNGNCQGGWSTPSKCENGMTTRRYVVEKIALPGFSDCPFHHGEIENGRCDPKP